MGLLKSSEITKTFIDLDEALEWVENQIIKDFNIEEDYQKPLELEEFEALAGRKESTIMDFKMHIKELSFKDKESIFLASDFSNDLYFIRKGVVKIVLPLKHGQTLNVSSLGRGAFFGEFSFLDNIPRSAHAIASGDVELYVLTREDFDNFTSNHKISAIMSLRGLVRALVWRLRNTNAQLGSLNEF
ncbi:MAG: cyclic nucleotide-binding domain-containing protein [Arcobacteraceae bacterium]|nr:cyclic nucleotide-binding domain-containing protein [Arcobacteraceae bacterium]